MSGEGCRDQLPPAAPGTVVPGTVVPGTAAPGTVVPGNREGGEQRPPPLRLSVGRQEGDEVAPPPPVTVVLDGRSICHRVHLDRHTGYRSLAAALNRMFVCTDQLAAAAPAAPVAYADHAIDLDNAVPGHIVAYEDLENDLLLVGDLKWDDFVRVAKRIRVIPVRPRSRPRRPEQQRGGGRGGGGTT